MQCNENCTCLNCHIIIIIIIFLFQSVGPGFRSKYVNPETSMLIHCNTSAHEVVDTHANFIWDISTVL